MRNIEGHYGTTNKKGWTLSEVERFYKDGRITESELNEYLLKWNEYPYRNNVAYWMSGAIRLRKK